MTEIGMSRDHLSIGIVTHNNRRIIEKTLDSIYANRPLKMGIRLNILDNASTDGTFELVDRWCRDKDNAIAIESTTNSGFGCGHNEIFSRCSSQYHLICNPDITLTAGALDILLNFINSDQHIGMTCPRVKYPDGRLQPLNRRYPSILDIALRRFVPARFQGHFKTRMDRYNMLDIGYETPYEVPFVSGAFMLCRSDVLKAVGGFDERFFLYFEDADLSRKIQENGWATRYCPEATVIHEWQRDAHRSLWGAMQFSKSAFKYFSKWGWRLC